MSNDITRNHYDVIVLGVGSMGSAACWHLARRGQKVLGIEQFDIPHENGSHAGQSRIIRKAYFEHPDYVPLLERAYENWRSFEKVSGTRIYYRTGILYFGEKENANIRGIRTSARLHGIPVQEWTHAQYTTRYPAFRVPDNFDVIYEEDAGFVTPEQAIRLYADHAVRNGAVIMKNTAVKEWKAESKIRVVTRTGEYTCGKLVITSGAWTARLVPQLKAKLHVTRQLLAWVAPPEPDRFSLDNFPCWFVEDPALGTFYGFPVLPSKEFNGPIGLKLAHHHPGIPCGPDDILGDIPVAEEQKLRTFLRTYLPGAGDKIIALKHCLYTYSPDTHFIIDHLPGHDGRVVIACGFSGHGFKFASVVGEILADLAVEGKTDLPIGFLRLGREA